MAKMQMPKATAGLVRYGLLGGERWQIEAANTRHKNGSECVFHKFSCRNS
jgi:hypothetical protein